MLLFASLRSHPAWGAGCQTTFLSIAVMSIRLVLSCPLPPRCKSLIYPSIYLSVYLSLDIDMITPSQEDDNAARRIRPCFFVF